jgi:predicted SprT family Zn-dependent metalloprotease
LVVRCYNCKKRFKSDLKNCPHCEFENLKFITWIPEELKIKHAENYKTVRSALTISEIRQHTENAAKDCDFQITELTVTNDFEGVLECTQFDDDYHKIQIRFNPKRLAQHNDDEIRALLRHEIMHPITMRESSKIMITDTYPEMQELQKAVQTAYDEMINYKEYSKRFPHDPNLHSAKEKVFTNFSLIFLTARNMLENNRIQRDHPFLFVQTLAIYEDAVYNFFENTSKLDQWVNENSAQALNEFLRWIHEDFNTIQNNVSNRDEMREIIFLTFKMMASISIDLIYTSNTVEFNAMWPTAYQHCQNRYTDSLGTQLLSLWKKRFDESPKTFLSN